MTLFIRRGSAFSSGCWNSQAECHDRTGVISKSKPSPWHSHTPRQTLPKAPNQDPGYRRNLPPLHRRLITLNLTVNNTQCTPPPPARPAPPGGGGFLELLQSQPTEMVSHFLMVILMFAMCQLRSVKFIKSVLWKHR